MVKEGLLFDIADRQQGYFTARQAEECGFHRAHFHRFLSSGKWINEQRGIYRLAHYPVTERPELVIWSLWSQDRAGNIQGVWSHATALDIYELSDVMPAKMHMTVPKRFRKGVPIPKLLILHFTNLSEQDVQRQQGYLVTTPFRTLLDIVADRGLSDDLITQALEEAIQKGLVSRKELKTNEIIKSYLDEYKI